MAEAFGRHLVPIPFAGPVLAAGLLGAIRHELAGPAIDGSRRITLALDHDLFGVDATCPPAVAWDAAGADAAVAVRVDPDGAKVLLVEWTAGERLVDLVVRIGEMIAFQAYNIQSPLDAEAAMWADLNRGLLPTDARDLRPADLE